MTWQTGDRVRVVFTDPYIPGGKHPLTGLVGTIRVDVHQIYHFTPDGECESKYTFACDSSFVAEKPATPTLTGLAAWLPAGSSGLDIGHHRAAATLLEYINSRSPFTHHCTACNTHYPDSEPNQPNGTLVCYSCRSMKALCT